MSILSKFFGNIIKQLGGGKSTAQTLAALVVAGMNTQSRARLREQMSYLLFAVDVATSVQPDEWRLKQAKDFLDSTFMELEQ